MNYIRQNYFSATLTPEEKATKNAFENMLDCLAEELKDSGFDDSELVVLINEVIGNIDYILNAAEEGIYSD